MVPDIHIKSVEMTRQQLRISKKFLHQSIPYVLKHSITLGTEFKQDFVHSITIYSTQKSK